jgi:hypothetical protein
MKIKIPRDQIQISVEALEEDSHWTDKSYGYDPEVQQAFQEMVDAHGLWGWCCVKVTASWREHEGCDYLGCCSYRSGADFIACNDYYTHMVEEAIDDLHHEVVSELRILEELRAAVAHYVTWETPDAPPA